MKLLRLNAKNMSALWLVLPSLLFTSSFASAQNPDELEEPASAYVVFSPKSLEDSHLGRICQWLEQAQSSIDIAMYSMRETSVGLVQALESALRRGVRIRFLFDSANEDRKSPQGSFSARLEELGIDVRYINKIMHHKFALIDARGQDPFLRPRLITGSANWTSSAATYYDENTLFLAGETALISRYRQEFDFLWKNSRDFIWQNFDTDFSEESLPLGDMEAEELLAAERSAVFTSANFEVTNSRWGKGFRTIDNQNTVSQRIVELFQSAKSSIRIASGHLRSHVISSGLIAVKQANPDLVIEVYLDNQEFISSSYNEYQKAKRSDCIAEASSPQDVQDCFDRGYYYSLDVANSGIDVRFKTYAYRWHYSYAPQMHHKYILIDDNLLLTGSYNFSDNAEHETMENVIILAKQTYPQVIKQYLDNFTSMWNRGRDKLNGLYQSMDPGQDFPIVFDAMSLSWQEVDTLKAAIRKECPRINSDSYRKYPEKHRVCER